MQRKILLQAEPRDVLIWLNDWFTRKALEEGNQSFIPISLLEEIGDDSHSVDVIFEELKKHFDGERSIPEGAVNRELVRKFIAEYGSLIIGELSNLLMNEKRLELLVQAQYSIAAGQHAPTPVLNNIDVFSFKLHRVGEPRTQVQVTCDVPELEWILDDLWQDIDITFEVIKKSPSLTSEYRPDSTAGTEALDSQKSATEQKRGPQSGSMQLKTIYALNKLREIRADAIRNHRSIPTKEAAMQQAGITYKTCLKHAPELLEKWDDENYRPEKLE